MKGSKKGQRRGGGENRRCTDTNHAQRNSFHFYAYTLQGVHLVIIGQSQTIHKLRVRYQTLDVLFTYKRIHTCDDTV